MHFPFTPAPRAGLALAMALAAGSGALPARADPLDKLQAQIEALQRQIDELKARPAAPAAPAPAQAVTGGATPGSFKLPGSDTSVTIGGYAKLDALYSSRSAGGAFPIGDQLLVPGAIPVGPGAGNGESKELTLHARQSRFFVRTATPSRFGPVTTLLEYDFIGSFAGDERNSNNHSPRLRHAYGSIGPLSAGQFWTNFFNEGALPETLDFGGPVGYLFVRQAQVRWTQAFDGGDWSVSAESPESALTSGPPGGPLVGGANGALTDDDRVPDLTARVRFKLGTANLSVAGLARNIRFDNGTTKDSRWGGAFSLTGIVPVLGKDELRFNLNAGNVLGRYQELGFFPDGHIDDAGELRLTPTVSGFVAYRHWWTPELRSSLVLSASQARPADAVPAGVNKEARSAHLNLIWSPLPKVSLGGEYIHARRELTGTGGATGLSGSLNRLQLSATYNF